MRFKIGKNLVRGSRLRGRRGKIEGSWRLRENSPETKRRFAFIPGALVALHARKKGHVIVGHQENIDETDGGRIFHI